MKITAFFKSLSGKKLIQDSGTVLVDQGLMSLGTFVVGVLVARSVSREDYGLFVLGWSLIFIIQGLQRGLVVLPFTVFCHKMTTSERSRYLGSGLVHSLAIGLSALLVFSISAILQSEREPGNSPSLLQTLPLLSLVILPFLLREQMRSAAIAKLDFLGSAKANIFASILMLAVTFILYIEGTLTLNTAYTVMAITSLLSGVLLIYRQRDSMLIDPGALWPDLKYSFRIGKWILLNVIAFTLASQIYPWLILWFLDSSEVAAYGACLAIAGALNPLLRGVNAYALPRMVHGYRGNNSKPLLKILWKTVAVLGIPFSIWAIFGSLFAEQLMEFFYTGKYTGYGILVSLLILRTLVESVSTPFTSALQTLERPDVTTISLAIGAAVSVLLGTVLIKEYGLTGAGITALLSSLSISAWKLQFIYRNHQLNV